MGLAGRTLEAMAKASKRAGHKSPTVTVRFANPEGGRMAKKNGKRTKRRNPSNPRRRTRHHAKRRNPSPRSGGFMNSALKLAGVAAVTVVAGIGVTYAMSKIQPGTPISTYGVPAAAFVGGVLLAKKMPTLGAGLALGS